MTDDKIPFLDLITPHIELEDELVSVFRSALRSGGFIGGAMVEEFEEEFARYCGTKHCVGVGSGTDALRFALIAAGIKEGDRVITVPNTFIATTEAITQAGARVDFVDIDPETYNMDVNKLDDYLKKTSAFGPCMPRAVIPVHLYGQISDMDSIIEVAEKYGLVVIEDACQAHGAEYLSQTENRWKKAGSIGKAAAFSFYPGKNLGACGEGGAVTTNDERIAQKVRMLRDHGQEKKYLHRMEGYNGRLDAIQAGILKRKLAELPKWSEKRRRNACLYNELLGDVEDVVTPCEPRWVRSVYHLYVIRTHRRDELRDYLSARQVSTGLHYPIPLHLQEAYSSLGYTKGDFSVSEKVAGEILSLPMYPELTGDQQRQVVERIKEWQSSVRHRTSGV
ncbi:MAG: DegT/DnrJ/EryC1/StrS family aminotransferase [DPANN group archaeon]|nr:DegT/DnrJ/EryC1/StrS family aminotransferase [DPANN group archaeon]